MGCTASSQISKSQLKRKSETQIQKGEQLINKVAPKTIANGSKKNTTKFHSKTKKRIEVINEKNDQKNVLNIEKDEDFGDKMFPRKKIIKSELSYSDLSEPSSLDEAKLIKDGHSVYQISLEGEGHYEEMIQKNNLENEEEEGSSYFDE